MTVYTTLPTDDSNLEVELTENSDLVTLNLNPAQVTGSGGALGTVTNVATGTGLTGGPITTSGTIAIDSTVATLDGAQALTNKTGLISQWTNDAGYITSETDNQTLSFTTPDISISGGNSVDLSALTTTSLAFSAITSTPTTIAGYGITDAFDGVYSSLTGKPSLFSGAYADLTGKPSLFSGAYADLTGKPTIPTNNNQLTNGAGYTTNTGTVTASSTDTFTNKSGNISQWTNDAGYLTSSSDNQTLSFANPNLSISNGNSVDLSALTPTSLAWSAITSTPTTLSGYGITDAFSGAYADLTGKPTIPDATTINNNANNRVITGSDTANTLEGEANFTWDGTNGLMSGTSSDYSSPILHLKTDTSGYNKTQLLCEDDNGKVFAQVGQLNTGGSVYQWNITLDPDNTHGRSGVTTYAGDYFVSLEKNYSTQSAIRMDMNVYGANDGFHILVRDDFNSGGGNQYGHKPLVIDASELIFKNSNGDELMYPQNDGNNGQVITTDGNGNLTFEDAGGLAASTTPTLTGDANGYHGLDYVVTVSNYSTAYVPGSQFRIEVTKDSDSSVSVEPQDVTDNGDGTFTFVVPAETGAHTVRVKAQDFNKGSSAEATMSLTLSELSVTARYWRIKDFDDGGSATNSSLMVADWRVYTVANQGGPKIPVDLSAYNFPLPYVVSETGAYNATYAGWKAFDNNLSSFYWNLSGNMSTDYLAIDLGSAQTIKSFSFRSGNGASYTGPFTIYYATQSDFSDEVKLKRLEFTAISQNITFG